MLPLDLCTQIAYFWVHEFKKKRQIQ
jgi:hypothetical protein